MAYWSVAQVDSHRVNLVVHYLELAGHAVYAPRIAAATSKRRTTTLLFPSYVFVQIEVSWWHARWAPGVLRLILNGERPARVPDRVISELRNRARIRLRSYRPALQLRGSSLWGTGYGRNDRYYRNASSGLHSATGGVRVITRLWGGYGRWRAGYGWR